MQNAYYLRLGSGRTQLIGISRDRYHFGWIRLLSFHPADQPGFGSASGSGRPKASEFMVSKYADDDSPELALAVHTGRHFQSADLEVADAHSGVPKLRMSFTSVVLTAHTREANPGADFYSETFTLNFGGMTLNHNPIPHETAADMLMLAFKRLGLAAGA